MRQGRPVRGPDRREPAAPGVPVTIRVLAVAGAFPLVMLLAPADSNFVWAVNGWRSIGWAVRAALLVTAGAGALLVYSRARGVIVYSCSALLVTFIAAVPLRVA